MSLEKINLVPVDSSFLRAGQRVIKCGDMLLPIGIGGNNLPSGGSSMNFYKCTSVDTVGKTWSGNKAVLTNGIYTISPDITSGLSYTSVTPSVGKIYSSDALVEVRRLYMGNTAPTDGLVFYAPLAGDYDIPIGPPVEKVNESGLSFNTYSGVECLRIENGGALKTITPAGGIIGSTPRSVCFWGYPTSTQATPCTVGVGDNHDGIFNCGIRVSSGQIEATFTSWGTGAGNLYKNISPLDNKLHFFSYVYDTETTIQVYLDGKYVYTHTPDPVLATNNSLFYIGESGLGGFNFSGYICGVRIYNRALSATEVDILSNEFTPEA